jgi:hypothetical protein
VNDATRTQLRLIAEIASALDAAGIAWWLFGGWAMDLHAQEVTRDHDDIEMFIRAEDGRRVREALVRAGFVALPGLHPDEGQPFVKDGQEVGTWFIMRDAAGRMVTPGRWCDWPWPDGAFDGRRVRLGDREIPVMSAEGLLEMKLGYAKHPHGAPLRAKDIADIERLRAMLKAEAG